LAQVAESDQDGVASNIIEEFMKAGEALYKKRDGKQMMRDVIDLIGINLEFGKRLVVKLDISNGLVMLDKERKD
jgi:hypothetical protein